MQTRATETQENNNVCVTVTVKLYSLLLAVQHRQVEVDKFEVAGWSCVVSSLEFAVESFGHLADACMYLHTHLGYLHLQNTSSEDLLRHRIGTMIDKSDRQTNAQWTSAIKFYTT